MNAFFFCRGYQETQSYIECLLSAVKILLHVHGKIIIVLNLLKQILIDFEMFILGCIKIHFICLFPGYKNIFSLS